MLLRQTVLYLPAQVIGPLVQFVSIVLWTHFLLPEDMGVLALLTATQELGYTACLFWFSIYTIRYFDKSADADAKAAYFNTERSVLLLSGVLSALAVTLLPLFVTTEWSVALLAAALVFSVSRTIATHLADRARSAADMWSYSVLQIAWPVLGLVLGLILIEFWSSSVLSVVTGYAAGQVIALALVARRLMSGSQFGWSRSIVAVARTYAVPLVIGSLFVWLANNGIRFLVEHREGAAAVGMLTIGWALGLRVAAFSALLVTAAAFPLAVQHVRDHGLARGQAQLVENAILLLAILIPACAGLWVVSGPLVSLMVAPAYQTMTAAILPWAIIAGAARNFRIHSGEQVFLLHEETVVSLVNDAIDGAASMIGAVVGLVGYGLVGSVVGAAVGAVVSMAVTLLWARLKHGFSVPLRDVLKIGAATLAMVLAVSSLPAHGTVGWLMACIVVGGIVYSAVMALAYPVWTSFVFQKLRGLKIS